jgi:hypothetical protein
VRLIGGGAGRLGWYDYWDRARGESWPFCMNLDGVLDSELGLPLGLGEVLVLFFWRRCVSGRLQSLYGDIKLNRLIHR